MTRLPHASWDVVGVNIEKEKVKVGPRCSVPGCERFADHAHHIWRRSFLAGDYQWIYFKDNPEMLVCNLTGLCFQHHQDVTENKAVIRFTHNDMGATFTWASSPGLIDNLDEPLDPQPEIRHLDAAGVSLPVSPPEVHAGSVEVCKTCGHTKKKRQPKADIPAGEKRPKRTWSLAVPVDHRENGYEIIESLLFSAAELLGRDEDSSWRYYTLVEALALIEQHKHLMVT